MTTHGGGRHLPQGPTATTDHLLPPTSVSDTPDTIHGELRARYLNEQEQYAIGYAEGFEAGYAAAHADMAAWYAPVARLVRQRAGHPTYAERAAAEAEWIKPREGDFTGELTPEQYFGGALRPMGRAT